VLLVVGSDNLNRRSWTHDSEISCSVLDAQSDPRAPADPGGLGDGARRLARDARLRLWREHLGRAQGDDNDLVDPAAGFAALSRAAADLDAWHQNGKRGPRPPGHLRRHDPEHVARWARLPALALYRTLLDPDGRPADLRRRDSV
jgi:phosphatidylserine/phosphatidylglycerophosphate/cardiolipin synthase-like enzyme